MLRESTHRILPRSALVLVIIAACGSPIAAASPPISLSIGPGLVLPSIATDLQSTPDEPRSFLATQPGIDAVVFLATDRDGKFQISALVPAGAQTRFSAVGDLTGNGLSDIVTTSPNTGRAYIVLQTEFGAYTLGASLPVGLTPYAPALADLTEDGLPDLIVPLRAENSIAILPNLGDGLFAAGTRVSTGAAPEYVAIRDFDRDGALDLAVTCAGDATIRVHYGSLQEVDGGIVFVQPPLVLSSGPSPTGLIAADFDGDGHLDLATASIGSSSIRIFYGTPDAGFEQGAYLFAGTSPQSLIHADLNLDGRLDLVVANPGTQTVTVLENTGNRAFERRTVVMPFRPARVAALDVDGDGLADLFTTSQTTVQARSLINQSEVVVCPGDVDTDLRVDLTDLNLVLSSFGSSSSSGDTNGDGVVDLTDLNLVLTHFGSVCGERSSSRP